MGILYVVGTPIGNLGDMTYRAVETLKNVDFIAAEDTRVSVKLLNYFDIKKQILYHFYSRENIPPDSIKTDDRVNNYLIQAQQAKARFLTYDQQKLIAKLNLSHDDTYFYPILLGSRYRIHRETGEADTGFRLVGTVQGQVLPDPARLFQQNGLQTGMCQFFLKFCAVILAQNNNGSVLGAAALEGAA